MSKNLTLFNIITKLKGFSEDKLNYLLNFINDTDHIIIIESKEIDTFVSEKIRDILRYGTIEQKNYNYSSCDLHAHKEIKLPKILYSMDIQYLQHNRNKVVIKNDSFNLIPDTGICVLSCEGDTNALPEIFKELFKLFRNFTNHVNDYETHYDKERNAHYMKLML